MCVSSVSFLASGNETGRSSSFGVTARTKMINVKKNFSASRHSSRTFPTNSRAASKRAHHVLKRKRLQHHQSKARWRLDDVCRHCPHHLSLAQSVIVTSCNIVVFICCLLWHR